jgi:hypothetical protein
MSQYYKHIAELYDEGPIVKVERIKSWLLEYDNYLKFQVSESSCGWTKWLQDRTTETLPCHCKDREEACVFIETYNKLEIIVKLYERQDYIAEVLKKFDQIKNNPDLEFEWVEEYAEIADFFKGKLQIKNVNNTFIVFEFDKDDFYTAILFEDIVMEVGCTEEYQTRSEMLDNVQMFDDDEMLDEENY